MKVNEKNRSGLVIVILFLPWLSLSCKKWVAINSNPNIVVESNTANYLILPSALLNSANLLPQYNFLNHWMGYWCPPSDALQDQDEQSYNLSNSYVNQLFSSHYRYNIDYDLIERKAKAEGQGIYEAIARTMKVYHFTALVDLFNNVPYSDALQANSILNPRYEDGKKIYEKGIADLDDAVTLIRTTAFDKNVQLSTADILFKGDTTKWIKFINTLKLRLLIHQSDRLDRANYIQDEIIKLVSKNANFLESGLSASVNPGYVLSYGKTNYYYNYYGYDESGVPSNTGMQERANVYAMNFLKTDSDPRLEYLYKVIEEDIPSASSEPFAQLAPIDYRGNVYGLQINTSDFQFQDAIHTSAIGIGVLKDYNMPMWMITSVESLFLQAEAIQRGWLPGDAKMAYVNAVKESFIWLNVNGSASAADSTFNEWYAIQSSNPNVNWDVAPDKYKLLMYQKYAALNGIAPLEVWTDYRRNGEYPDIPVSANFANTSPVIPVRLLYPTEEYANNRSNVQTQGTINQFTSKIWWMP